MKVRFPLLRHLQNCGAVNIISPPSCFYIIVTTSSFSEFKQAPGNSIIAKSETSCASVVVALKIEYVVTVVDVASSLGIHLCCFHLLLHALPLINQHVSQ